MTNKNKIINQAQKFIQKGQWDKAIKELQKLVAEDPSDVRTLLKLGDVFAKKGDREQATKVYKQVAESYSEQGFFLKAVAVYKQILKHDQKNLEVTLKLAELYEHLGLTSEAMVQYQVASQIHDETGNSREALDVLKRMVELDAENVASRIKLAESYSRENMVGDAIEQFQRAAEILKRQGRVDDYIKVAERLVYHDPNRLEVIKELANIYISRGDTKRGLAKLQLCFKAQPRDVETLTLLAGAFRDLGQLQKTVFVYRELARIHQENGDDIAARATLQKIIEIDPSDPEARTALGLGTTTSPNVFGGGSGRMPAFGSGTGNNNFGTGSGSQNAFVPAPGAPPQTFGGAGTSPGYAMSPQGFYPSVAPVPQSGPRTPSLAPRPSAPTPHRTEAQSAWRSKPSAMNDDAGFAPSASDERLDFGSARGLENHAPPPQPVQSASMPPPASKSEAVQISKILTETDVYIKYGLRDKALEHLRKIFELDPDNTLAYTKMRDIYLNAGDTARAAEAIANLVHIHQQRGDDGALEGARAELMRLAPGHPLIAGNTGGANWTFGQHAEDASDSIDITEDSDVYDLNEVADEPQTSDSLDAWLQHDPSAEESPLELPTETPASVDAAPDAADPFAVYPAFGGQEFEDSSSGVSVIDHDIVDSSSVESGRHRQYANNFEAGFESEATDLGLQARRVSDWEASSPDNDELALGGDALGNEELAAAPAEPDPFGELDPFALQTGDVGALPAGAVEAPLSAESTEDEDSSAFAELADLSEAADRGTPDTADLDLELATPLAALPEVETTTEEDLPEASVSAVVALDDLSADLEFASPHHFAEQYSQDVERQPEAHAAPTNGAFGSHFAEAAADRAPKEMELTPEEAQQIEDELDEAEFLAQQGLEDDARELLLAVLEKVPNHERAQQIRALFDSSMIGVPKPDGAFEEDEEETAAGPAPGGEEAPASFQSPAAPEPPEMPAYEQTDEHELDGAFDNLGTQQASDENPEDHYDEGMAYKELGRLDDAIAHFQIAVQSPAREIAALEMIGQCLLAKNDFEGAINSFWSALERGPEAAAATNLKFEIANAYEVAGDLQQAVVWYGACYSEDPQHRDVADRLRNLENGAAAASSAPSGKKSKISYL